MTFGQQPQGGNTPNNNLNGQQPQYQYQNNAQQPQYGQSQYQQYGYAQNGTAAINTQAAYAYEEAQRVSVTRAYGEMTIGLLVTAVVAIVTQMTGLYITFLQYTGIFGVFAPAIVQIVLAVYLGARITRMTPSSARVMFYVYAALMGFTLSIIFAVYDLGTIGISPYRAHHRRSAAGDLRTGRHRPDAHLRHRAGAVRRHDRLRRPGHPRPVRPVRGRRPGHDQEDLDSVRVESLSRLREHVPVHPASVRQP